MACTIALLLAGAAVAQQRTYPEKAVRVVVPFPAGGAADALPRMGAERLRQIWNQPVVVENRGGAGGNIGASVVAAAEPDGYTLFSSPPGPFVINDSLYKQLSYNPTEFEPIVILAEVQIRGIADVVVDVDNRVVSRKRDLIKLAIDKLHRYLNPCYAMFLGEINCLLGMLKVESFERVGGPISEPAEIELRTRMLQQDFH